MIRDRKQQYEELKAKDAESAKKIDEQMERIKTITVILISFLHVLLRFLFFNFNQK